MGWIKTQEQSISIVIDPSSNQHVQNSISTLASLCRSSLNNMMIIAALLQQYASDESLNLKALENMSKAVLQKLSQMQKIKLGYYFDSATLKSFISILKQNQLISVEQDIFILHLDFEDKISVIFKGFDQNMYQTIQESVNFSEKELKIFKQMNKKSFDSK